MALRSLRNFLHVVESYGVPRKLILFFNTYRLSLFQSCFFFGDFFCLLGFVVNAIKVFRNFFFVFWNNLVSIFVVFYFSLLIVINVYIVSQFCRCLFFSNVAFDCLSYSGFFN